MFDFESLYYSLYVFTNAVIIGGPPPSYRSSTYGDESSSLSDFPNALKRRSSWLQLIENNENLQLRNAGAYPVSSYKKTTNNGFSFNFDNAIPLEQISPVSNNYINRIIRTPECDAPNVGNIAYSQYIIVVSKSALI